MTQHDPSLPGVESRPRILVVEDDVAASRGLSKLLQAHGFAVTEVNDGAAAIAALGTAPTPEFVVTDWQLPDCDGREIGRFCRTLDHPPKVAIVTGWDPELSADECAASGINWVLAKPLHVQDLLDLLQGRSNVASSSGE